MACEPVASSGLVEGTIVAKMADLWAAARTANAQTIAHIGEMLDVQFDVPALVNPISFASAVAGYTPFVRPTTPVMPVFSSAPSTTPPDVPDLQATVSLGYVTGLPAAVDDFVAGGPEADIYARLRAAQDRLTAADVQAAGERMAAAGWAAPTGFGATMIRQSTERGNAAMREAMRAAWAETRGKAIDTGLSAVRGQNEAIAAHNTAVVSQYDITVKAMRFAIDVFDADSRAKSQVYDAQSRMFTAELGAESARVDADSRLYGIDVENARAMNSAMLTDREISINATLRAEQLRQANSQAAAEIAARITSGAMSGLHVSASMSSGVSASNSTSCSTSYSIDATPAE